MDAHGQRWNLRKFASVSIQKVARPSGINMQVAAETDTAYYIIVYLDLFICL